MYIYERSSVLRLLIQKLSFERIDFYDPGYAELWSCFIYLFVSRVNSFLSPCIHKILSWFENSIWHFIRIQLLFNALVWFTIMTPISRHQDKFNCYCTIKWMASMTKFQIQILNPFPYILYFFYWCSTCIDF